MSSRTASLFAAPLAPKDHEEILIALRVLVAAQNASDCDHEDYRDSCADVVEMLWAEGAFRLLLARLDATPATRYDAIDTQLEQLRSVRENLRTAGADKAADAVARAMKSVEGARRHAKR